MSQELELSIQDQRLARPADVTPGELLSAMMKMGQSGLTPENAAAIKTMAELYEHMQDREAEKAFAAAFVKLQQEIPKIQATKAVPNSDGTVRYKFAPLEELDEQARPICHAHGFTYFFSEGPQQPGTITKICTLQHVGGHKRSNPYSVRIGKGPPGCSESQADGAAHSYCKRGALCDALAIVVRGRDNDARDLGACITKAQADDLRRRVKETASDLVAFLRFAKADKAAIEKDPAKAFETIPEAMYGTLDSSLRRKEKTTA